MRERPSAHRRGRGRAEAWSTRLTALLLLLVAPGCHSWLVPFDERALPAHRPIDTRGGARLHLDDRGLVLRPAAGDVSAFLGVGLSPVDDGLAVTHRLRADALLLPGDVILHCASLSPPSGELLAERHTTARRQQATLRHDYFQAAALDQPGRMPDTDAPPSTSAFDLFDPSYLARPLFTADRDEQVQWHADAAAIGSAVADVRARRGSHAVRTADDLRGYLLGHEWAVLDLVVRRDGEEVVVRQPLRERVERIPIELELRGGATRWHGVDLVSVGGWPEDRVPLHHERGDLLVTRVARDSPLARAGLRPLDLVPGRSLVPLLLEEKRGDDPVRVRDGRTGELKALRIVARPEPVDLWLPFLFSFQDDGVRWHIGLGPLELLYHATGRVEYDAETDTYERIRQWSVGTSVQSAWVEGAGGQRATGGVNLFFDGARSAYWVEWYYADEERRHRRETWDE